MKTTRISKYGHKLAKTRTVQRCNGCGRILPKGSLVLLWSIWDFEGRHNVRICQDCERVVYDCEKRRALNWQQDECLVRDLCKCCDLYPWCEKVEYLRNSAEGEVFFGAVDADEQHQQRNMHGKPSSGT
mgnify:CR=1 FL=1